MFILSEDNFFFSLLFFIKNNKYNITKKAEINKVNKSFTGV